MGLVKAAVGDAVLTFMWIICASTIGATTSIISDIIGVEGNASLAITTALIFVVSVLFGFIADAVGGASFNATGTVAFYIAGAAGDDDTLMSTAVRFPAQAVGAVGGVLALMELMPLEYKHMLEGPTLKVDLHTGAIAEGVLTFAITFAVLLIIIKGPKSFFWKNWMISVAAMAVIVPGSSYTGPSMNPANAFGWAYVYNKHNTWEQFYVYWICPSLGAILAGWLYRLVFPPRQASKQKTA
ncbi:putative major intrinsic protein [Helianthus annuus]|uniref:Major intrinsic protein n=1 Tax=Helianthus annuus TaxID=4232 RepID=A0A251SFX2_HELAN|nr:aquaporin SIP1-2 [Helianthus annuus]KAF5768693.1 putative major intrinsic protein [Helianthus annuus]KAJ0463885.1 putative major intrinsic protein [Helianthus annuus]KAJ0468202.1 putative major intrinsic protein [Helianthus annuus]KAJ0485389.1 putative major intrinsic protein [Helianthus annuus]KAJ0655938.1 putative major intrinsic protein [Helianthus annuus]